ncbi:MAG: hypothetical protein M3R25_02135 [Bacteroidota bacterium]|nr:hypothetical protein [Bacteroidota bacterium]
MRYLVLLIILLAINSGYSQCKYVRNQIDEFEKMQVTITKDVQVCWPTFLGGYVKFSLRKIGGYTSLGVRVIRKTQHCFDSESELLIMTDDGEITRLPYIGTFDCSKRLSTSSDFQESYSTFEITEDQLLFLEKKKMVKIRLYGSDGLMEYNIDTNNSSKEKGLTYFMVHAKCILDI